MTSEPFSVHCSLVSRSHYKVHTNDIQLNRDITNCTGVIFNSLYWDSEIYERKVIVIHIFVTFEVLTEIYYIGVLLNIEF